MKEILNLHLVSERVSSDKIRQNNNNQVRMFSWKFNSTSKLENCFRKIKYFSSPSIICSFSAEHLWKSISDYVPTLNIPQVLQVPTNVEKKFLYFNVLNRNSNRTITVEGGGVNATIIQSDIAATNGFVHIIDHVLGVPYTTVLEKLDTDPMLKWVK